MATITAPERILLGYSVIVFLLVFFISLGAKGFAGTINNLQVPTLPPSPTLIDLGGFVIGNIGVFITVLGASTGVAWIGLIIFAPAIVFLVYFIIRLAIDLLGAIIP